MGTYRGMRIGKATTNLVPLSRMSKNKVITVVSGTTYTASVRGTAGSISLSGAGSGTVTEGNPRTFVASSSTLTIAVTGYLKHIQVEAGSIASSEVWTSNPTRTRSMDAPAPITGLQSGVKLGASAGAVIISLDRLISNLTGSPFLDLVKFGDTATNNSIRLLTHTAGTGQIRIRIYLNGVMTEHILTTVNLLNGGKLGLAWTATELRLFLNGTLMDVMTQSIPGVLDSLVFNGTDNEAIYKGIYFFATRPTDPDMVISTNY